MTERVNYIQLAPEPAASETSSGVSQQEQDREPAGQPAIYVASLSDYNNGILHGAWIDATQDETEVQTAIQAMLDNSPTTRGTGEPAEEFAIHDYDSFGGLNLDENESIATVTALARLIGQQGQPFIVWADIVGIESATAEDATDQFTSAYASEYDSAEDYARKMIAGPGLEAAIKKAGGSLAPYITIDYAAMVRNMIGDGDIYFADSGHGSVYVFH
ncbi:MAG: antirestriction protein ArdA [Actinomycetia bacterium]|nr:antirestriction protein ArdA [Actinomycetes bacterium]